MISSSHSNVSYTAATAGVRAADSKLGGCRLRLAHTEFAVRPANSPRLVLCQ